MVKRNWKIRIDGFFVCAITGKNVAVKFIYDQALNRWPVRGDWKKIERGGYVAYTGTHGLFEMVFR